MAKNPELEKIVIEKLYEKLKDDPNLRTLGDGEEEFMKSLIQSMGELMIDKQHKIRHFFQNYLGYGYDFNAQSDETKNSRKIYEQKLETLKKLSGHPNIEVFVDEGVVDNRFGWYITRV